jgi:outer membrane immunogenic protein
MKNLMLGAAALIAGSVVGSAFAADLPVKAPPPVPVFNWTGWYIGGNIGGTFASSTINGFSGSPGTAPFFAAGEFPTGLTPNANGVMGGAQLGYNWQTAAAWVVGLEADIQGSSYKGWATNLSTPAGFAPFTTYVEEHGNWFGTVRGRVGYLVGPNILLYGTGGFAYGQAESSFSTVGTGFTLATCPTTFTCAAGSSSSTRYGWAAGTGFEVAVDQHWTVRGEYLYLDLGTQSATAGTSPAYLFAPVTFTASAPFKENILRLGFNYKL